MVHKRMLRKDTSKKLLKITLSLSLICMLILPHSLVQAQVNLDKEEVAVSASTQKYSQVRENAMKKAQTLIQQYGVTSIQYSLMEEGKIIFTDTVGYANISKKETPTKDTMYGIGSVSKLFTTISILQLTEKGMLELDTPIIKYMPDFKMADERYKDITVRMLLNHSSGLRGNSLNNALLFNSANSFNKDNFLKQLSTQSLISTPGSYSVYCNDGFTLAEILIEKVCKTSFTDYIQEHICDPLELNNTKTPADSFNRSRLARTYDDDGELLPYDYSNIIGAGGIYSSSEDLCKLSTVFTDSNNTILSQNSTKAMSSPEYLRGLWGFDGDSLINYGLGWDAVKFYPFNHYNIQALAKGGDTLAYHAGIVVLPDSKLSVAVTSSGGFSTYNEKLATEILEDVLLTNNTINEKYMPKVIAPTNAQKVPEYLTAYNGVYSNILMTFKIKVTEKGLDIIYSPDESIKVSYIYTGNGKFKDLTGATELSFVTLANSKQYIQQKVILELPGLDPLYSSDLLAVKLEDNEIDDSIWNAWKSKDKKTYFLVNEVYNSQVYQACPVASIRCDTFKEGYIGNFKIKSKDFAITDLQIPGSYGRDLLEMSVLYKDGIQYLQLNSGLYVPETEVKVLPFSHKPITIKLGDDGFSKWFKTPKCVAGKTISVKIPEEASFAVYDKNGQKLFLSAIEKNRDIELPLDGYIVFIGSKDSTFTVLYK